jgi:NAD-dependent dihydropyrimidine dehydrogenase PreA subunit
MSTGASPRLATYVEYPVHLQARKTDVFAKVVCDIHSLRPPDLHILDALTAIVDECIACYCCAELCPEGAIEVPDVEAFRHY